MVTTQTMMLGCLVYVGLGIFTFRIIRWKNRGDADDEAMQILKAAVWPILWSMVLVYAFVFLPMLNIVGYLTRKHSILK